MFENLLTNVRIPFIFFFGGGGYILFKHLLQKTVGNNSLFYQINKIIESSKIQFLKSTCQMCFYKHSQETVVEINEYDHLHFFDKCSNQLNDLDLIFELLSTIRDSNICTRPL